MAIHEDDWSSCGSRGLMRNVLKSRPYSHARWLIFNLACLERISDLLDDTASHHFLKIVSDYASDPNRDPLRQFTSEERVLRESQRGYYSRRKEPLYDARCAASLALQAATCRTLETSEMVAVAVGRRDARSWPVRRDELRVHCDLLRDIFGNPFRPVVFDPAWRSESAVALARTAYESRNFSLLPILADALEEAGCDHPDVLAHCRRPDAVHVRGCWVVDGVLGQA